MFLVPETLASRQGGYLPRLGQVADGDVAISSLARIESSHAMHFAVREFKDGLSELLRRAEAGEGIVDTSHGRPVARLVPVEHPGPVDPAEALKRLRSQP